MTKTKLLEAIRSGFTRAAFVTAFVFSCGTISEPARAGLPVWDYTSMVQKYEEYFEMVAEWQQTFEHYQNIVGHQVEQARHWKTQLNKLARLEFSLFEIRRTFSKTEDDQDVDIECPGRAPPQSVADLLNVALNKLVPDLKGGVLEQQHTLCVEIVRSRNAKYNDTVRYLDFMALKAREMAAIQAKLVAKVGESSGNTAGLTQQLSEYGKTVATARANWQASQQQFETYITRLLKRQSALSRRALNGAPDAFGTIVNTVALKAALSK
ncbi:hypothetical protein L2Y94_03285 [Luteibacter aegosomatis]|uniref:hypothetical protein n=1 Tax=Luteibacter aegosomatis TaxID=2911537 RepID=UPI001FFAC224|nr:hypothetical protein [Luteibacter aegosomatis]UPG86397.1 hypothetical protein L2Y94_03285 [Luteibacter aegosomatis]